MFKNFKKVGAKTDENNYITEIFMTDTNIFDIQRFKTYYIKPKDLTNKYPQIKIESTSAANAMLLFSFILRQDPYKEIYKGCTGVNIIDSEGNIIGLNIEDDDISELVPKTPNIK